MKENELDIKTNQIWKSKKSKKTLTINSISEKEINYSIVRENGKVVDLKWKMSLKRFIEILKGQYQFIGSKNKHKRKKLKIANEK